MLKYTFTEKEPINATRVFALLKPGQRPWDAVHVWWHGSFAACTQCSGPLKAMLGNCTHAQALKRHIAKEKAQQEQPK